MDYKEKVIALLNSKELSKEQKEKLKSIFPELKESEDERIKEDLIQWINEFPDTIWRGHYKKDVIAWLEKQDKIDKASYEIAEEEKREFVGDGFIKCYANFQDFKEGETYWLEYIGNDNYNVRSDNLLGKMYHITTCQLYTIFKKQTWLEKQGELIRDTDTADSNEDGLIAETIRYKNEKQGEQKSADDVEPIEWSGKINSRNAKGVLKEMLDKKLKPDDKVEPKFKVGDKIQYLKGCGTIMTIEKIENGEYIFGNNLGHITIEDGNKWYLVEQKPAWSEEDEYTLYETIQHLKQLIEIDKAKHCACDVQYYQRDIDWLESLKHRVLPQPKQDWNKKDKNMLNQIINSGEHHCYLNLKEIDWLKSLRPQNRWKPSDEQMKLLKELVEDNNQRYFYTLLRSLYDQLKILKGE